MNARRILGAAGLAAIVLVGTACWMLPIPNVGAELSQGMAETAMSAPELSKKKEQCAKLRTFDVPLQEEQAFGGAVALTWVNKGGGLMIDSKPAASLPKNALEVYVNSVGKNLAAQSARPLIDWTFGVLDSPNVNAISTPAGYVLVTRGLLARIDNEAQLAGVLGHEIAHIAQRHAINAYRKVKGDECERAFTTAVAGKLAGPLMRSFDRLIESATLGTLDLNSADNLPLLKAFTDAAVKQFEDHGYERDQELEADRVGLLLAVSAGYNPNEYIEWLGKLPAEGNAFPHHPAPSERQAELRKYLESLKEDPLVGRAYPFKGYAVVPLKSELKLASAPTAAAPKP